MPDDSIKWKWMAIAAFGILITAGGGWMSYVQSQINTVVVAQADDRKQGKQEAIENAKSQEKVINIEKKVDAVDKKVEELRGDIKEILRNQQQQIFQQQRQDRR